GAMLLALVLACSNPWEEAPSWATDGDSGVESSDTGETGDAGDTGETGDGGETGDTSDTAPHGRVASDAVGDCVDADALAGATTVAVTGLWEGDIPGSAWDTVPAKNVISEAAAYAELEVWVGADLPDVDFAVDRVVVLSDWRSSTCGLTVEGVEAWAMPAGDLVYVEGRMRTDGSAPCEAVCEAEGSRMTVVRVPAVSGVLACRRTETWCP
ncbi:MAG: hypothetical protein ACK4YP_25480, partial [Myxococcota bacterium]